MKGQRLNQRMQDRRSRAAYVPLTETHSRAETEGRRRRGGRGPRSLSSRRFSVFPSARPQWLIVHTPAGHQPWTPAVLSAGGTAWGVCADHRVGAEATHTREGPGFTCSSPAGDDPVTQRGGPGPQGSWRERGRGVRVTGMSWSAWQAESIPRHRAGGGREGKRGGRGGGGRGLSAL